MGEETEGEDEPETTTENTEPESVQEQKENVEVIEEVLQPEAESIEVPALEAVAEEVPAAETEGATEEVKEIKVAEEVKTETKDESGQPPEVKDVPELQRQSSERIAVEVSVKPAPPKIPPKGKPEPPKVEEKKEKKAKGEAKEKKQKKGKEKAEPSEEEPQEEKGGKGKKGKKDKKGGKGAKKGPSEMKIKSTTFSRAALLKSKSEFSFEEYSTSSSEEAIVVEKKESRRDKDKKKGKKEKGKKAKKGKEKEEEKVEEPVVEEDDFMANLLKMKAAAAAAVEEPTEEAPPEEPKQKKEKPPKKKKGKKVKLTAAEAEKLRIEAEAEAARLAELERIRLEEERRAAIEKEAMDVFEQQLRVDQLEKGHKQTVDLINRYKELTRSEKKIAEWEFYISCAKLPNPSMCQQMNTYLHLWEKDIENTKVDDASKRTSDTIKLLKDLEDELDTAIDETKRTLANWRWVRQLFRDHQKTSLDVATYRLLRCVEKNLHRIDIPTADFNFKDDYVSLSIWLRVKLPIPLPNPRRPPKPRLDVAFPNVGMKVFFPITINCDNMAIRAMYLKYDHLSDLCETFNLPQVPTELSLRLVETSKKEWRVKLKYKYANRDRSEKKESLTDEAKAEEDKEAPKEKHVEIEKEDFESDEEIPAVPYKKLEPTASETAIALEDEIYVKVKEEFTINLPDYVINLRKFTLMGGLFTLNLLYQPPQPQDFVTMNLDITTLYLPKKLEYVQFGVTYIPPQPSDPNVRKLPEEIEEEMKKQEEEMDKLMLITLTWPQDIMFFELPFVCYWDEEEKIWSKKDIHDLKHNEEKGILTFRTGLFGTFGLATIRYANLPFQAWELKPEPNGSVTLQITASILMMEFNVKDGLVSLSQLTNSPNTPFRNIVGVYYKLYKLKRILKETGLDVFPELDAYCYIEGNCEKHWPMEKHLYYQMAQLATTFNFAWSRWNLTAGRRKIVMQMREHSHDKAKLKNHSMLLITPLKATIIDCTEVSQVFCEDDVEQIKFSSDLSNLIKATTSITLRKRIESTPWEVVYALSQLLISTRVLSFS